MIDGRAVTNRRTVLRALALGLLVGAPACAAGFTGTRLVLATGVPEGNYFALGTALGQAWADLLGVDARVESTDGSPDNLARLAAGDADVAFSQVDTATDTLAALPTADPGTPRALARIYDDYVHVVVPGSSPVRSVGDLRGARVSIGARDSGVYGVATRLLEAAGLSPQTDVMAELLGLSESATALREGRIDAFFWSGGVPTRGVTGLAEAFPVRLLDLGDTVAALRRNHPLYAPGTVPAMSYPGFTEPITTVVVRNFLLVRADMAEGLAHALAQTLFRAQPQLVLVSPLALTIDLRAAIGTQPVPLHPGAERFFREAKDT